MKTSRFIGGLVVVAILSLVGLRILSVQRVRAARLSGEVALLDQEIKSYKSEAEPPRRGTSGAESAPKAVDGQAADVAGWSSRVARLKKLFADRADAQIPELRYLTPMDWAELARYADFETDLNIRRVLSESRTLAKEKFTQTLSQAVKNFIHNQPDAILRSMQQITPYFPESIDLTLVDRYEVGAVQSSGSSPAGVCIREKAPIDAELDYRFSVSSGGEPVRSGPSSWDDGRRARLENMRREKAKEFKAAMPPPKE
jgi:hypothetical protein